MRHVAVLAAAWQLVVGCLVGRCTLDVVAGLEDGLLDILWLGLGVVVRRLEFLRVLVP